MTHSSHQGGRKSFLDALLSPFLHPDVTPLVLDYEATIQFELQRSYGTQRGDRDGELQNPYGLALSLTRLNNKTGGAKDELVVVDSSNSRIQVFHQRTGRFLRQWGRRGRKDGELIFPITAVIRLGTEKGQGHQELFVRDVSRDDVQIFRYSDGQFLRGFPTENRVGSFTSSGIAISKDDIFVSQHNQIDIKTISEGKTIRNMKHIGCADNLWIDEEGHELFIAYPDKNRVEVLDITSGQLLRGYGGPIASEGPGQRQSPINKEQLNAPRAVVAHGDEVIICDTSNQRLVVFDRLSCRMLRPIGVQDGFYYPYSLALNCHNQLFVCDSGNDRVLLFE